MAKSSISKSKPHHFLCCFGFSGKFRRFKPIKPAAGHKNRPFSWIKLHFKPPPSSAQKNLLKPDSDRLGFGSVISTPPTAGKSSNQEFAVTLLAEKNQSGEERPEEVGNDTVEEKIINETVKNSNSPKTPAGQSQSRFSLTRKLESFRSGRFTKPSSPSVKGHKKSTATSHPFSCPPPSPPLREPGPGTDERKRVGLSDGATTKNYGPAAGLSILILTLAIMVLWGKLCAIFCTAAWIFVVTSLRSIVEEDAIDFIPKGLRRN